MSNINLKCKKILELNSVNSFLPLSKTASCTAYTNRERKKEGKKERKKERKEERHWQMDGKTDRQTDRQTLVIVPPIRLLLLTVTEDPGSSWCGLLNLTLSDPGLISTGFNCVTPFLRQVFLGKTKKWFSRCSFFFFFFILFCFLSLWVSPLPLSPLCSSRA